MIGQPYGMGGIRTLGTVLPAHSISNRALSTTQTPFLSLQYFILTSQVYFSYSKWTFSLYFYPEVYFWLKVVDIDFYLQISHYVL